MVSYEPPKDVLSIFNPNTFPTVSTININTTTLKADTDAIQTAANAQYTKFSAISSLLFSNTSINFTVSTFDLGATGHTWTPAVTLSSSYYWILSIQMNIAQSASVQAVSAVEGVLLTNNWLNTQNSWSSTATGSSVYGNPAVTFTMLGLGNDAEPAFVITFPQYTTAGYATNPNSWTATGTIQAIGIKIAGV
jgi:hypothetical protein